MRGRVAEAVGGADAGLKTLIGRSWLLGPHDVGPNLLLAPEASARLFAAPASILVRVGKRAGEDISIICCPYFHTKGHHPWVVASPGFCN